MDQRYFNSKNIFIRIDKLLVFFPEIYFGHQYLSTLWIKQKIQLRIASSLFLKYAYPTFHIFSSKQFNCYNV